MTIVLAIAGIILALWYCRTPKIEEELTGYEKALEKQIKDRERKYQNGSNYKSRFR